MREFVLKIFVREEPGRDDSRILVTAWVFRGSEFEATNRARQLLQQREDQKVPGVLGAVILEDDRLIKTMEPGGAIPLPETHAELEGLTWLPDLC